MAYNILNNYITRFRSYIWAYGYGKGSCYINKYLINNNFNESLQSAYMYGHMAKTGLIRVKNDIMMTIY